MYKCTPSKIKLSLLKFKLATITTKRAKALIMSRPEINSNRAIFLKTQLLIECQTHFRGLEHTKPVATPLGSMESSDGHQRSNALPLGLGNGHDIIETCHTPAENKGGSSYGTVIQPSQIVIEGTVRVEANGIPPGE